MIRKIGTLMIAACIAAGPAQAADKVALAAEGKALMQAFGGALKGELQSAMKAGGPTNAVEVCNLRALDIALESEGDSGWVLARSSHKLRNPSNAPDDYTTVVIEDFLARQEAGEKAVDMVKVEIVEDSGQSVFRMVKAIPTGKVCLACHGGDQVSSEVEAKLAELYPDDQARGFSLGQMRGVFTLMKPLQ